MANQNRSFLKNQNRDFNNILDSVELAIRENSSPTGTSTVLTNADSGKIIFMDASSANTITLPAVATTTAGWNVKIILTATGAAGIINTSGAEDKLVGFVSEADVNGSNHTITVDADADRLTFVDTCNPGSFVEIVSNGTLFYVYGFGTPADKLTLTKED
jgi:hypothetical protein